MKIIISFIILLINCSLFAQVGNEYEILNDSSFQNLRKDNDKSIQFAHKALKSNEGNDLEELNKSYLYLGINYTVLYVDDSAFFYLQKIQEPFVEDLNNALLKLYTGMSYSNISVFDKAQISINEAIPIFAKQDNYYYLAECYNALAITYARQDNLNDALPYFSKAYNLRLSHNMDFSKELNNLSLLYTRTGDYALALDYGRTAYRRALQRGDSLGYVQSLITVGNIYIKKNDPDSALYFYHFAQRISLNNNFSRQAKSAIINSSLAYEMKEEYQKAIQNLNSISTNKLNSDIAGALAVELALLYLKTSRVDSARINASKAYELAKSANNITLAQEASALLSQIFTKTGVKDSVIFYLNEVNVYSDSIYASNNQRKFADFRVKFETLAKDTEIQLLKEKGEVERLRSERMTIIFSALLVVVALIIVLLVYIYKTRLRQKSIEKEKLEIEMKKSHEDLYKMTISILNVNNCLNEVEERVKEVVNTTSGQINTQRILNAIKLNKTQSNEWDNFYTYFSKVHQDFYKNLLKYSSEITNHEQRVSALVKLGLNAKEIAAILNIETKSVTMIKYRIKKKLDLPVDQDLDTFIRNL